MKKYIGTYARISVGLAFSCCLHAGVYYLLNSINDQPRGEVLDGVILTLEFVFMIFNGILMTIAGIYLVLKGSRPLGWATIVIVFIFYTTALLIHLYQRHAA